MVQLIRRDARRLEAVVHRMCGEAVIVLGAREALLLRSGDDLSVTHERRGTVVVKRGYAENIHALGLYVVILWERLKNRLP